MSGKREHAEEMKGAMMMQSARRMMDGLGSNGQSDSPQMFENSIVRSPDEDDVDADLGSKPQT